MDFITITIISINRPHLGMLLFSEHTRIELHRRKPSNTNTNFLFKPLGYQRSTGGSNTLSAERAFQSITQEFSSGPVSHVLQAVMVTEEITFLRV